MKNLDILKEDRVKLKAHYEKLYTIKFPWGDKEFIKTLVNHSYRQVVENMDAEEYFNDIQIRHLEIDEDF
jgi:hypothetical protein